MNTNVPKHIRCIECGKVKTTYRNNVKFCGTKCKTRATRRAKRLAPETPKIPLEDLEIVIYRSLSRGNAFVHYETTTIADIKSRDFNSANRRYWTKEEFEDFGRKFNDICGSSKCLEIWQNQGYRRYILELCQLLNG